LSPAAFEKAGFNLTGRGGIWDRDKHKHGTGEKASVLMARTNQIRTWDYSAVPSDLGNSF
jgi:hypothetical protein